MGSSVREEQTGSYEIDPDIRAKARELLGLGATVQNVSTSTSRMTLENSRTPLNDTSEGRLFHFLSKSSRETIDYALGVFNGEIHLSNDEEAKTQLTARLGELEKIGYPVGEYSGLQPFELYAHFVCLRGELKRRYQHRR